jgi:glycosyltransferase involved in cell wall biosynthesis|nr:glycosyltransferase [uncultured Acetatifactor sp.]
MGGDDENGSILLSVIIPVYNVKQYLKRCVDSIAIQDIGDMEIILVNDGSTDCSGEICDALKDTYPAVVKVIHKENGGLSSARNVGLDAIRGKYVFFLDSDDSVHIDFLKLNRSRMRKEKYDIIEFMAYWEKEYNQILPVLRETESEFTIRDCIENILKNRTGSQICLKLYRSSLFSDIRFPEGRNYEDIGTCYKLLLKADSILHIDSEYYIYNITNASSITKRVDIKNLTDMYSSVNELCEGVGKFCESVQIDPIYIEYYKRHSYIYIYLKLLDSGEDCELKCRLRKYLADHNRYNLIQYRYYDIKRWGYYQLLHLLHKA